jgi:hypothetical protein
VLNESEVLQHTKCFKQGLASVSHCAQESLGQGGSLSHFSAQCINPRIAKVLQGFFGRAGEPTGRAISLSNRRNRSAREHPASCSVSRKREPFHIRQGTGSAVSPSLSCKSETTWQRAVSIASGRRTSVTSGTTAINRKAGPMELLHLGSRK